MTAIRRRDGLALLALAYGSSLVFDASGSAIAGAGAGDVALRAVAWPVHVLAAWFLACTGLAVLDLCRMAIRHPVEE